MKMYDQPKQGYSMFSGQPVIIIGEGTNQYGEVFYYNIEGYTPENGKPFESLKCNIIVEE